MGVRAFLSILIFSSFTAGTVVEDLAFLGLRLPKVPLKIFPLFDFLSPFPIKFLSLKYQKI